MIDLAAISTVVTLALFILSAVLAMVACGMPSQIGTEAKEGIES